MNDAAALMAAPTGDAPRTLDRPRASVCPFCGSGCGLLLQGAASHPLHRHPVSQGALCLRGWSAGELATSPLRVATALRRERGGPLVPLATEAALAEALDRLRGIRERHGGAAIGILGSARITVEEALLLRRLAAALGTPHLDTFQRAGYLPFPALGLEAIENAPRLTVLGANLTVRQPQVARRVLRALDRGARVRFVHSRRAQLTSLAARHDLVAPGTELEALGDPDPEELVLISSEIPLAGQGGELYRKLAGRRALFLTDYANQRGAIEAGLHPAPGGLSAWEMLEAAARGDLKALLVFADDPFEFFPELSARAFAGAELAVVVDAVQSPTARRADLVLPGALLAEKRGTVVNVEGRSQQIEPASASPAGWSEGAIASWWIERLGGAPEPSPAAPLVPGPGSLAADRPGEGFPYLAALDTTLFWNSHALIAATVTAWREARSLFADFPPGFVTLNPDDGRTLGISYAGAVTVASADGAVTLPARFHPRMLRGTVWIPMPFWERCGRALGALAFDPSLGIPVFRPRAVRLSRPAA